MNGGGGPENSSREVKEKCSVGATPDVFFMSEDPKVLCGRYYFPHLMPAQQVMCVEAVMASNGIKTLPPLRVVRKQEPQRPARRKSPLMAAMLLGAVMGMR